MNNDPPKIKRPDGEEMEVRNIYCVGRNYVSHVKELNSTVPKKPVMFQKSVSSLSTSDKITIPTQNEIQHELEVVVLIGSSGFEIKKENAKNHIGGFGLGLDLTDRKMQKDLKSKGLPWFMSKNFRNSTVVSDFIMWDDTGWNNIFWLEKNQNRIQEGLMADMIFSVDILIEFLSFRIPLREGDLFFTGTPEGVGPVEKEDELKLGLGKEILKTILIQ